ncbi:MAG: hypothetical protein EHM32_04735 [Spirochaetales bacterium]|nr:MAG: hypothetical protein EHM32_04735 [Spirochaetales bacterium]
MDRPVPFSDARSCPPVGARFQRLIAVFFLLAIVVNGSTAAAGELMSVLSSNGANIPADLYYLEDPNRDLTIREIAGRPVKWKNNENRYVNFGYSRSAYWFRVDIHNPRKGHGRRSCSR